MLTEVQHCCLFGVCIFPCKGVCLLLNPWFFHDPCSQFFPLWSSQGLPLVVFAFFVGCELAVVLHSTVISFVCDVFGSLGSCNSLILRALLLTWQSVPLIVSLILFTGSVCVAFVVFVSSFCEPHSFPSPATSLFAVCVRRFCYKSSLIFVEVLLRCRLGSDGFSSWSEAPCHFCLS